MNLSTSQSNTTASPILRSDKLLSLLGGNVRFEVIRHLADRPQSVSSLAEQLDQSIGLVSHNLRLLRQHDLVEVRPNARQRIYSLSPKINIERQDQRSSLTFSLSNGDRVSINISLPTPAAQPTQVVPSIQVPAPGIDRFKNHDS